MEHTLGLVSVSFRDHSPEEILSAMKRCGLGAVEWGSDVHVPPHSARSIAALQKRCGVECCSYGTYFRLGVTPTAQLAEYIAAAKTLGTHILRLWCGNKNSEDHSPTEKEELFGECRRAADMAEKGGVTLCMECHGETYTNTAQAAYELMQEVGSPHFRMYWQPGQYRTKAENLEYARLLAPYTKHLHVFNWAGEEKYPLGDAVQTWREYLDCFEGSRTLLLEFMPDGRIESLEREVQALKRIAE